MVGMEQFTSMVCDWKDIVKQSFLSDYKTEISTKPTVLGHQKPRFRFGSIWGKNTISVQLAVTVTALQLVDVTS